MLLMLIISKVGDAESENTTSNIETKQMIDIADVEATECLGESENKPESKNSYIMLFVGLMIHDVSEGVMLGL